MTHILACTDGSVYAPSVYDHAAWAARRIEASLEVLHVLDHKRESAEFADRSGSIGLGAQEDLLRQLSEIDVARGKAAILRGRAVLDAAAARLTAAGFVPTLTQRHGSFIETLEAVEVHADLVVIGKRGEAANFATPHLGANLERAIRGSRHPILVASRAFQPIKRVLIAYDGGTSATKAVTRAAEGKLLRGLEIDLLTVGEATDETRTRMANACAELAAAGLSARAVLADGEAETVIARHVKEQGIDLLVVGAYGHSRIRHLLVGSTTTALIRSCQVPLLMFR